MTNLFVVRSVWAWRTKWVARASSMAITKRAPARVTSCKCKCHPWLNEKNNKKKTCSGSRWENNFPDREIANAKMPHGEQEDGHCLAGDRGRSESNRRSQSPVESQRPTRHSKKKNVLIKPAAAIVDVRRLVLSSPSHLNGRFRFLEERRRAENKKRPKSNRIESNAHS